MVTKRDWTLLALAAANGEPLTPVQLQKSLFLLGQQFPEAVGRNFYRFQPYNYGPFTSAIYEDAATLHSEGLAVRSTALGPRPWYEYAASPQGIERANEVVHKADAAAVAYLRRIVEWARGLSFQQLVSAIYEKYPEQKANSIFR